MTLLLCLLLASPVDDRVATGAVPATGEILPDALYCGDATADALPGACALRGAGAYPQATVNTAGGILYLGGGEGVTKIAVTRANCAGNYVAIGCNGLTPVQLDYGAGGDWVGASDALAATSLAAAATAQASVLGYALSGTAYLLPDATCVSMELTTDDATCAALTDGSNAGVVSRGPITVSWLYADYIVAAGSTDTMTTYSAGFVGDSYSNSGAGGLTQDCAVLSASPATSDVLCSKTVQGKDSGGNWHYYSSTNTEIALPTNGSETGIVRHKVSDGAGVLTEYMRLDGTAGVATVVMSKGLDLSEGNIANVGDVQLDSLTCDADATTVVTLTAGQVTIDDTSIGADVDSPKLALHGNSSSGGNDYEVNSSVYLVAGDDPYLRVSVDDVGTAAGTLTGVFDVHDTVMAFVTDNTVDIGGAADNRPKDIYATGTVKAWTALTASGAKGQTTAVPMPTTVELTCDSAATLSTVAGFIPAGVYLHGITTRVTSAGLTGPTSMDIGDGSVASLWGDDETVADNDTTDNTDATANWGNPLLAQSAVVLTWNGGNCTAGTVRVSAHYTTTGAPTAD